MKLQILASHTDDPKGIIYDRNIYIIQAAVEARRLPGSGSTILVSASPKDSRSRDKFIK